MFRSVRWRSSEKDKIKAVFKLQFHATQVLQPNVGALVISVVPGDVGKPTTRLEKGIIEDGSCRWEYPVYETIKFVRDAKTGKINEQMYHFVVSNGSSKNSSVGEVSIDFADYAEATKVSTVSLPLKKSKSNGVLHVSIQRLQSNVDQREVEEIEDGIIKPQIRTLNTLLSNGETDEGIKSLSNEDEALSKTACKAELNGNHRVSSGSDVTLSSSGSSSGLNTPWELALRNGSSLQDPSNFLSSQGHTLSPLKQAAHGSATTYAKHQQSQWEWMVDSDQGISTDDSANSFEGNLTRERSHHASDTETEKLKAELVALARQVDVSDMELQTLRKQIVKESKKGQDLAREVSSLTEERDAFKSECERLKAFQKRMDEVKSKNKLQFEGGNPWGLLEEIRQELTYEKDLNANLQVQLQKTQESNNELILAVKDLEEMLEQKGKEIQVFSNKSRSCDNPIAGSDSNDDEEQQALEELVKEHRDAKESYQLEQKIMDLCSEIEIYKRDKDELEMQMEQLALDYEILKQENHHVSNKLEQSYLQEQLRMQYECSSSFVNINELEAQIENLEKELKEQSKEYSDSLATIKELESNIKSLGEELEKQAEGFEADLEAITCAKIEQEQRAIQAEEALRKTRWKNANTAEKLQQEFKKLSVQMASTFEANEKVAMKALAEASELRMQKVQLEEMLCKANEELQTVRDDYEAKLHELSHHLNLKANQIEEMLVEITDTSKQLEQQKKHEEELSGAFLQEILRLKAELERLTIDNNRLSEQAAEKETMRAEMEQMKTLIKHTEDLVERGNADRNELESAMALVKKEAEKSMEELNRILCAADEKETAIGLLQSEVETVKSQCNDLKNSLFEDELEKEKLRKQVLQLKGELKKKDDTFTSIEKKLKESNKRIAVSDGTKTTMRNKSAPLSHGSKEVANLREKIKSLEVQIKLKETTLETSANSFSEKERNLQNKIQELESSLEELNQNSANFRDNLHQLQLAEDTRSTDEKQSSTACMSKENGNAMSFIKSNKNGATDSDSHCHAKELLSELETLKERNKSMESELKDMQERYSEISLKFAEVEGERQQLVMTIRNLKNAKKS